MSITLLKTIGAISATRIILICFQMANIWLYTKYLTPIQLGFYFYLLTISFVANALIFSPVDYYQQSILLNVIKAAGSVRPILKLNSTLLKFYLAISVVGMIACQVIEPIIAYYIPIVTMLALLLYASQALRNIFNTLEYQNVVSASLIYEAALKIIFFGGLLYFYPPSALLLLIAWLIALTGAIVILLSEARKRNLFSNSREYPISARTIFNFSYPISIGALCNWVQMQGYRLVLVPLGYTEVVGIFATVSAVGSAGMAAASAIFSQTFRPRIYQTNGAYTLTFLRYAVILVLIVLAIAVVIGEVLIKTLTGSVFQPFWVLILVGIFTEGVNLAIGALSIQITMTGNSKRIMISALMGVIGIAISLSILLYKTDITPFSIGLSLLVAPLMVVGYLYICFVRSSKDNIDIGESLDR